MKLGYSMPQIVSKFKELQSNKENTSISKHDVPIGADTQLIEVYEVPIDLPRYRLANTRTIAYQEKYIADNDKPKNFFDSDPLSNELQEIQHQILSKLINRGGLKEYFSRNSQTDPLIVTNDGFVVSGNRRLCAMRELFYSDGGYGKYKRFERIRIVILPNCTEEELEYIEDYYEQQQDIRDPFTWYNRAIGWKKRLDKHRHLNTKKLSERSGVKELEIKKLLQALTVADSYLEEIGKPKDYEFVENDKLAFDSLLKARKKFDSQAAKKTLFQKLSFIALKNQEKMGGRMYDNIPYIQETLDEIEEEIMSEFEEEIVTANEEATSVNPLNDPTLFSDSSEQISVFVDSDNGQHEEQIFSIVLEKVTEYKLEKQDKRKKQAVLKSISKAYKALIEANNVRDHDSDKNGIIQQIENIERVLKELKEWAVND